MIVAGSSRWSQSTTSQRTEWTSSTTSASVAGVGRLLAILLLTLFPTAAHATVGSTFGFSEQPIMYVIDGYLDRAPPDTVELERATLGAGGRSRLWLLTFYQRDGSHGDPWLLTNNIGAYHPDFLLIGVEADIERILDAPPGTHIHGRFQYLPGIHSLVIDPYALAIETPE